MASSSNSSVNKPKIGIIEELSLQGLHPYYLNAPSWRAPWLSSNSSSGLASTSTLSVSSINGASTSIYPQFFPTCEGQEEDQLTESVVKAGYNNPFRGFVTVSYWSERLSLL